MREGRCSALPGVLALALVVWLRARVPEPLNYELAARELVSKIQQMRKAARFAVSDRVRVELDGGPALAAVVQEYESYIAGEVLASEITLGGGFAETHDAMQTIVLDAESVGIALTRVN